MKYFNIVSKQTYTDKQGVEKAKWLPVGSLKLTDDGKKFITLNQVPNETFYCFEQEDKPVKE